MCKSNATTFRKIFPLPHPWCKLLEWLFSNFMCRDHEATCPQMHVYNYSRHRGGFCGLYDAKSPPKKKSSIFRPKTIVFMMLFCKIGFFHASIKISLKIQLRRLVTTQHLATCHNATFGGCLSRLNFDNYISEVLTETEHHRQLCLYIGDG